MERTTPDRSSSRHTWEWLARIRESRPLRVLCLGAHCDDIEIGCGGTLLRIIREHPRVEIRWVVLSGDARRRGEAKRSAHVFLEGARKAHLALKSFRGSYFPAEWARIKETFERIHNQFEPDLVFTHRGGDRHQDHRVISDLTWNTFRQQTILEYEIPKYDGDLGQPNFYVPLDEAICHRKIELILHHFRTQSSKHWFAADTFWGLLRLRGIECGPDVHYAEAFHARKLVV